MFRVIPENFFIPLASPNRTIYWECICKLFSSTANQLGFGVERSFLVDELEFYFDQTNAGEPVPGEDEFEGDDSRAKANWMLRRLEFYGWIEVETDKSYVQRVMFRDYAVRIIKLLSEISEGSNVEYQGYIYTIYSLMKNRTDNPGIMLLQVVENTDYLITGLKNLNSSIKHYIDELTRHKTVSEIMDVLFNDYITNIVDKAYHRLLTSDNVAKFRPEIVSSLEKKSRSRVFISKASEEIAEIKEISEEDAKEMVYNMIRYTIDSFQNMDDILTEIDRKNTNYQKAAVNRARFLLISGDDVRGQLRSIMERLACEMLEESMDLGGIYRINYIDELIKIYSCAVIDEQSLYSRKKPDKKFKPEKLAVSTPDKKLREKKLKMMRERMEKILSPEKIEAYVDMCLGEKNVMKASEFPLDDIEAFVKLIYVRLYGQRRKMKYNISTDEMSIVHVREYEFRDFLIRKSQESID